MSKKPRPYGTQAPAPRPPYFGYTLTALTFLILGAAGGYETGIKRQRPLPPPVVNTAQITLDTTLGNAAFDRKNWPVAIQSYTAAIASGSTDPNVYTDLGTSYRFNGQPQQALAEYQAAQGKWPSHENSLFNEGGLYAFSLKKPDIAIKTWQSYLIKFPTGVHASEAEQLIAEVKAHTTPVSRTP